VSSITAATEAYAKKLEINKLYKQYRREVAPTFREAEKAARRRYGKRRYERFKLAEAFMLDNRPLFERWLRENGIG
jgi:nicotinate-nucleotide pyrophosphorylase